MFPAWGKVPALSQRSSRNDLRWERPRPCLSARGSENNPGNFAPRLGIAYRLTQDSKTSLRGGIGYFYTPNTVKFLNPFTNIAPFAPGFVFNDVTLKTLLAVPGYRIPFPINMGQEFLDRKLHS